MTDTPEKSTVRFALAAVAAIEDALDVRYPEETRLGHIADAIRAARQLRPHQLDDLLEHLDSRTGRDAPEGDTDGGFDG